MRTLALVSALLAGSAGTASAQVIVFAPELDPDRFVLTADPLSIGLVDGARPLAAGDFALGTALRVGGPPLEVCVMQTAEGICNADGDLVSSRFGADLVGAYGFGRVGIYAQLPIVLHQGSDFDQGEDAQVASAGLADLRVGGKLLVFSDDRTAFGVDARATVPTGEGSDFTGDGSTSIETRLIGERREGRVRLAVHLGYGWRQEPARLGNLYVDDELLWAVAGEYAITPDKLTAGLALFGRVGLMSDPEAMEGMGSPSGEERPAELLGSARYRMTPDLAIELGAGTALSDGYGAPVFRALLGVRWTRQAPPPPPNPDRDGDGILNDQDACPDDPEDKDGFEDADGCPDPDNDKDGILDVADACPNDPEDKDGFEDQDGCPDPDNDKDGLLDAVDACPDQPEDLDAFQDEDGCPDPDNDGDGILDGVDACPLIAEDADGFEDSDGCPEPDNDKDGLLDVDDACPLEAETYNGHDDADGCPDAPPTIQVTSTQIEITETIYFDTNKASIQKRSHQLLDGVAAALNAHKNLRVRVEGHTDDRADDDYNLDLSQRRAEAVRDYLIGKGIAADRLEAIGHGESRPKVEGKSKKARDANRRVEFVILPPP